MIRHAITHHLHDSLIAAYCSGALGHAFSLVAAAHVSLCDECRAQLEAHELAGGAVLDGLAKADLGAGLKSRTLAALDNPLVDTIAAALRARQPYPAAVMEALRGRPPRWRTLGAGIRQCILNEGSGGSVRLLLIPPGQSVPDHGHGGLELTLVLAGCFHDATGQFGVGDVEVAAEDLVHTPIAGDGADCICLAATDAPLRFRSLVPRLLQPVFRI